MDGSIYVTRKDGVTIHTYVAPDASVNVTSHILETPERLIIVDAQFLARFADEVREYAEELGKPIDRLIITHAHPDHYAGAARFDAPRHALREVIKQIAARGDVQDPTGVTVALSSVLPTVEISEAEEIIDGLRLRFQAVSGGEAPDELVILLPDHGVIIAQDLVYHDVHLFLGDNDISGWRAAAARLRDLDGYDVVLAGHGTPAGPEVFDEVERYLADAQELLGDDGDAYKAAIVQRYPHYRGTFVIDIANRYLFGGGH